jgi:CheY-like chemotaxis protein
MRKDDVANRCRFGKLPVWNRVNSATPTVLVVEGDWIVREQAALAFLGAGFVVFEAESADEAFALLRGSPPVDAIFTDIRLRGAGTGWDVAETCRATNPDLPIIYTSGRSIDPLRMVDGSLFFIKPYVVDDIVSACRALIGLGQPSFGA